MRPHFIRPLKVGLLVLACPLAGCDKPSPNLPATLASAVSTPLRTPESSAPAKDPDQGAERFDFKATLEKRRNAQLQVAASEGVVHGFSFSDRQLQSGLTFQHRVVPDAGKHYKAVHYDHGNGLAVADVDGDGLLDVYLATQLGRNGLYRNLGDGRFEDITDGAGVGLGDRVSVGAAFSDIDNDGDPDLFVTAVREGNAMFENLGGGRFRDVTEPSGLGYRGHSSGAVFLDFDRDGRLDLFVCNVGVYTGEERGEHGYHIGFRDAFKGHTKSERAEPSILYRNMGNGRFEEVSRVMNLLDTGWAGDATVCDVNEDGWPDLYVLNMQGDDHYYENQGGRKFVERTAAHFPKTPWGCMGVKFFDFNLDGAMDLLLTDMHSDMTTAQTRISQSSLDPAFEKAKSEPWCVVEYDEAYLQGASNNVFGNAFYINRGSGVFEEQSDAAGAETFWPWGVSVGDLNADGYEDVFVTAGMGFGFRYGVNSVLLNASGRRFVDAEFLVGVEPRLGGRTEKTAFVLECSGADREHPLCRGREGTLPVFEPLSSRSGIVFDLDNDGDLDIVTLEMNDQSQVLISDLAQLKPISYLKIHLTGRRSNRDAIGATVRVRAGGMTQTRYQDGKAGYFSFSPLPLYFGLGAAASVESVEIRWPNGKRQTITRDIPLNGTLAVVEE